MVKLMPIVPVVKPDVRFQPIWVTDVARAIALAAVDPQSHGGKTFELGGPRIYRFRELVDWITRTIRCRRIILPLPDSIGALIAAFDFLPGDRKSTRLNSSH